jgi:hypothetical protein
MKYMQLSLSGMNYAVIAHLRFLASTVRDSYTPSRLGQKILAGLAPHLA